MLLSVVVSLLSLKSALKLSVPLIDTVVSRLVTSFAGYNDDEKWIVTRLTHGWGFVGRMTKRKTIHELFYH